MNKNLIKIIIPIILVTLALSKAYAYDNGDFQIWNTNDEDITIGKATKLTLEEEYRYGENASELFYQHYDWGFNFAFDKRLEIQSARLSVCPGEGQA